MNNDISHQSWEKHKVELRKEFPSLTEEDLNHEAGKEEEHLRYLLEKLGKTKEEIRNWLHIMG